MIEKWALPEMNVLVTKLIFCVRKKLALYLQYDMHCLETFLFEQITHLAH